MFVCFKDLELDRIAKFINRLSCINCTGSILVCDSIHDKHLNHCAASFVDTSFSSSPSSSSSLHTLSLSVESPTTAAKISSSNICGEVGSSFYDYFAQCEIGVKWASANSLAGRLLNLTWRRGKCRRVVRQIWNIVK